MAELITNILRLNRIENRRIVPEIRRYDVCRQLADCLLPFESRWEEKNIEPDFDFEDSAYVSADESLLELVWNNLMSNAIKFTERGGAVTVRERTEGNGLGLALVARVMTLVARILPITPGYSSISAAFSNSSVMRMCCGHAFSHWRQETHSDALPRPCTAAA